MKIYFEGWEYECGDGCCYDYGTNLHIDGKFVGSFYSNETLAALLVSHLSPDTVVEFTYDPE